MTKQLLWKRLSTYQFEDLVPLNSWDQLRARFGNNNASFKAFAQKIALKNGWTLDFSQRALNEYKKYVFLGVISDFSVTPSQHIDAVWHEHCLFMKGYRKFCENIIEHDFLHYPELISSQEDTDVYRDQYLKTIALYKREFGCLPPSDIWALPKYAPRPNGIRAKQAVTTLHHEKPEYDLEDLSDLLDGLIETCSSKVKPLHELVPDKALEEIPESSAQPYGGVEPEGCESSSVSDSTSDSGTSCSSSSCGGGCGD